MAFGLYDAVVPGFIQVTRSTAAVLRKGLEFCEAQGLDPQGLVDERLCGDMLPLSFQVRSVRYHSIGALEGLKAGVFGPPGAAPDLSYGDLQAMADQTAAALEALSPDEIDSYVGKDMRFEMGELKIPFTAEGFLTSFSQPNFYFHAATTYDILRMKGVPLGKRDFLGALNVKR